MQAVCRNRFMQAVMLIQKIHRLTGMELLDRYILKQKTHQKTQQTRITDRQMTVLRISMPTNIISLPTVT